MPIEHFGLGVPNVDAAKANCDEFRHDPHGFMLEAVCHTAEDESDS